MINKYSKGIRDTYINEKGNTKYYREIYYQIKICVSIHDGYKKEEKKKKKNCNPINRDYLHFHNSKQSKGEPSHKLKENSFLCYDKNLLIY